MWIVYNATPDEGPEEKALVHFGISLAPGEPKQVADALGERVLAAFPGRVEQVHGLDEERPTRFPAPSQSQESEQQSEEVQ
jgi:hypothetical protein